VLGRFAKSRWVRGVKMTGGDQRVTWYELREPLLRHYLAYRQGRTKPLAQTLDCLCQWFDPQAPRRDSGRGTAAVLARPGPTP